MKEVVTKEELMELKHYSPSTYYSRRRECLASPYAKALCFDGNQTYINLELWDKFIRWKSDKKLKSLLGL